jgi:hypothetical protein
MRYKHINELMLDPKFPLKEHVENRNNIVIENVEKNISDNGNKTYAKIVSRKQNKAMISVSCHVSFMDVEELKTIDQEEWKDHSF